MSDKALSWKPIKRGIRYCSPACGNGCTHGAFRLATRNAVQLAKSLGGKWKPRVWENLGWHWSATFGKSSVHPREAHGYWASMFFGGFQWTAEAREPSEAVRKATAAAERFTRRALRDIARLVA